MASRSHRSRQRCRGVTLIEMLVVVSIMALIAAGIGVAAYDHWQDAKSKSASTGARAVRGAVKTWWVLTGNDGCPTLAQLFADRALDADSPRTDPWGTRWRIECSEGEVSVSSDGPDRAPMTADDIRVPPLRRGALGAPDDSS